MTASTHGEKSCGDGQKEGLNVETMEEDRVSALAEWFGGRGVLITGGTGFLGKALIERVLHSCPDVGIVYLLLRPKKGCTTEQRLMGLLENSVFDRLRSQRGDSWFEKVRAVDGDVSQLGLGISEADRRILEAGDGPLPPVSVVFHCAATVNFDDELRKALFINTRGVRELVKLGCSLPHLEALVHVSTTFCHLKCDVLEEVVYPSSVDYNTMIEYAEMEDGGEKLGKMAPELLAEFQNTYVLTKFLAEQVINDARASIPAAIYRPSVVCPAVKEPFPGWVQSFNGPMGIVAGAGAGVIRSIAGDGDLLTDLLPVDLAIAAILAIAWKTGTRNERLRADGVNGLHIREVNPLPVYNGATGSDAPISWNLFMRYGVKANAKYPAPKAIWYPDGSIRKNRFSHYFCYVFFQLLPAILVDAILIIGRKKPRLVKLQLRIFRSMRALEYFLNREWSFSTRELRDLRDSMSAEDAAAFKITAEGIDLEKYIQDWLLGMRRYMLNAGDDTLPKHRRRQKRLFWVDRTVKLIFWLLVAWWVTRAFEGIGGMDMVTACLPYSCSRQRILT